MRRDGSPATLENALDEGFVVRGEDSAAVLTMIQNFIQARDANHN